MPRFEKISRCGSSPSFVDSQISCPSSVSTTNASARPLGWYATWRYVPGGSASSLSRWPSSMNRFRGFPFPSANATARPIGCPQSKAVNGVWIAGRFGASAPTPRISNPASRTRSPCGPHENGPGSSRGKRHESSFVSGSSAQARSSATKATVWERRTTAPVHPSGSGVPSASRAPVGTAEGEIEGVSDTGVDGDPGVSGGCVHAPARNAIASRKLSHLVPWLVPRRITLPTVHPPRTTSEGLGQRLPRSPQSSGKNRLSSVVRR